MTRSAAMASAATTTPMMTAYARLVSTVTTVTSTMRNESCQRQRSPGYFLKPDRAKARTSPAISRRQLQSKV